MNQIVSITRQGQLTIPKSMRARFGIKGAAKALIQEQGNRMVVQPTDDFWSLEGSLKSPVSLSDRELRSARDAFVKQWPRRA
ncbi:MAG: AbrB/MazE/SpoVT family DNA-binding domain-containing protein [Parcubacteria group bacterium]|nr:AbrB/MazE/SpoVT family DNA-binding domain-containing protein [Parcubacteria group bacterium]